MALTVGIESEDMAKKNEAAVALGSRGGKARARNLSPEELAEIGRKGAISRWANMTPEQRRAATAKAVAASAKARRKRSRKSHK